MIVSCVLVKSPAFTENHVYWLANQFAQHMPETEFLPFSDVPLDIPYVKLEKGLPSWWAKFEALQKLSKDRRNVLMVDIDTVVLKPFREPVVPPGMALMKSHANIVGRYWGGIQLSTPEFREEVSQHFMADPEKHINESSGCDQVYYQRHWPSKIRSLQLRCPDQVVSYKLDVFHNGIQPDNVFVLFHGLPRPWDAEELWIPSPYRQEAA